MHKSNFIVQSAGYVNFLIIMTISKNSLLCKACIILLSSHCLYANSTTNNNTSSTTTSALTVDQCACQNCKLKDDKKICDECFCKNQIPDPNKKDGFWLVFDFGGGTFDAALLKVEEGIMKVVDTEGDNYLGGKNLDYAIVDEIILPYLQSNFVMDSILEDDYKKQSLRNSMKFYAEEAKIKMSFNETHNILSDLGDIPGEDDEGEEFELDITVTQAVMEKAVSPVFQKAIDISHELLKRNIYAR